MVDEDSTVSRLRASSSIVICKFTNTTSYWDLLPLSGLSLSLLPGVFFLLSLDYIFSSFSPMQDCFSRMEFQLVKFQSIRGQPTNLTPSELPWVPCSYLWIWACKSPHLFQPPASNWSADFGVLHLLEPPECLVLLHFLLHS